MYIVLVTLTALVHFTFCVYVLFGGFVALRWHRTLWLHVAAVCWGVASVLWHTPCPLTWLERIGRERAGMSPLPSEGFIARYITGVVYPADWDDVIDVGVVVLLLVSWWLVMHAAARGALIRAATTTTSGHSISVPRTARSASPRYNPFRVW